MAKLADAISSVFRGLKYSGEIIGSLMYASFMKRYFDSDPESILDV